MFVVVSKIEPKRIKCVGFLYVATWILGSKEVLLEVTRQFFRNATMTAADIGELHIFVSS